MHIEISDPAFMDDLRGYLQRQGCPSEIRGSDRLEVRVIQSAETRLSAGEERAKVFTHIRDWCRDHPGVKANLLS
jgi:hypothetical protein